MSLQHQLGNCEKEIKVLNVIRNSLIHQDEKIGENFKKIVNITDIIEKYKNNSDHL